MPTNNSASSVVGFSAGGVETEANLLERVFLKAEADIGWIETNLRRKAPSTKECLMPIDLTRAVDKLQHELAKATREADATEARYQAEERQLSEAMASLRNKLAILKNCRSASPVQIME